MPPSRSACMASTSSSRTATTPGSIPGNTCTTSASTRPRCGTNTSSAWRPPAPRAIPASPRCSSSAPKPNKRPAMTACTARTCAPSGARVVLVSPYELGRQPFNLAQPAAWFARERIAAACVDLSQQKLDPATFARAEYVAIYLGMHTATRIAAAALPKIRALAPHARLAAFGLYAPVNAAWLKRLGVEAIFGGESEPDLVDWVRLGIAPPDTVVRRDRIE